MIVSQLSPNEMIKLETNLTPRLNKFIPYKPNAKQTAFLLLNCREAFYGGAAGGGKSIALLMAALQYVDTPGYAAILLRRTFAELSLPDALMDLASQWLSPFKRTKEVHWSKENKTYTFTDTGATLSFGYLEHPGDKYRYQGAAFQFVGFDELTQFDERDYKYLFSRNRRSRVMKDANIPLRTRAASNPGGIGASWVKQRFLIEGPEKGRIFIPAVLNDNPELDYDTYVENLNELDPVTREQLLNGDWEVNSEGKIFKREWFEIIDKLPETSGYIPKVRYWDLAATDANVSRHYGYEPAYTVGLKMGRYKDIYIIEDIQRLQSTPDVVEQRIIQTAQMDGKHTDVWMEQEPGSSGIKVINDYIKILRGFSFRGQKESGSKVVRGGRAAPAAGQGRVKLLRGSWNSAFLDEVEFFPDSKFKDQVDSYSGAFDKLNNFINYSAIPKAVGEEKGSYWIT